MKALLLLSLIISATSAYSMQKVCSKPLKMPAHYYSTVPAKPTSFTVNGVLVEKDRFGNLLPKWQELKKTALTDKMKELIATLRHQYAGKAFIVRLPLEDFGYAIAFKRAGFTTQYTNDDYAEWVYRNGSPMPPAATTFTGSKIFLKDAQDHVLFVHDINLKGMLMVPGGGVDQREFTVDACIRELKEETGYTVTPDDLKLIAIGNRLKGNAYGFTDVCSYYTANTFSGTLKLQASEIKAAPWVSLSEIITSGNYKGLKPTITSMKILEHLNGGAKTQKNIIIPDFRQQIKSEEMRDLQDIMHLQLLAIE